MKVNMKILSIPPYISTSWKNVVSLHIKSSADNPVLVIGLVNGSTIEIPNLDKASIASVFAAHEKHLSQDAPPQAAPHPQAPLTPQALLADGFLDQGSTILSLPISCIISSNR